MQIGAFAWFKENNLVIWKGLLGWLRERKPLAQEWRFHVSDIGNIMKMQRSVMEGDKSGETGTD